jgi:molecular chaperone Hsp31 and glyoxalase 3
MQQKYKNQLEKPLSLKDLASKLTTDSYLGIFIPGGHGAMLGLPEDENVGKVLGWAMDNDKYVISICHGPAAFLANAEKFDGYSCVGFPTAVDKCMVLLGYMPGYLPWFMGDKLAEKNIKLTNIMTTGSTFVDRKLITGDGPTAANALGKLVAETILNDINPIKKPELEDADI